MQVMQDIRQPLRQGREVIRRLAVQFGSCQSHFLAVNCFEQRDRCRMIRGLLRQARIQAGDFFLLDFQTIGDLDFQQAGDSRRQSQSRFSLGLLPRSESIVSAQVGSAP